MKQVFESDVLVIGGGGAGARAVIEAHSLGVKITLVTKGSFALSGVRGSGATGYRGSGLRPMHLFSVPREIVISKSGKGLYRRIPLSVGDEPEVYFQRAIQAGLGMADPKLSRILVDEAPLAKRTLKQWGLVLDKSPYIDSLIAPMPGLGHAIRSFRDVNVLQQVMVTSLLIQDGACVGALGLSEVTGDPILLKARATILATGGNAQLFMFNNQPSCITGDGNAMGYDAGAELVNVEFGQVFITTVYPNIDAIPYPIFKLHPKVLNVNMEEFIHNYLPKGITVNECMDQKLQHGPFSSRDNSKYLEIAMIKETKAGRANRNNAFYMEIGGFNPEDVGEAISWQKEWLEYRGIDFTKQYIEINAAFHCSNGGLRIDENAETTIPHLYAVGELAAGPHGADRLGGAMMTASQVFGARAGRHAAEIVKTISKPIDVKGNYIDEKLNQINKWKEFKGSQKPVEFIKVLKKSAWENLLLVRTKESLLHFLEQVHNTRKEMDRHLGIQDSNDLITTLELNNLLQIGEIIAKVALMRTESRGSHYREDYPTRDDSNWLKSIRVKKIKGEMNLDTIKLDNNWQDKAAGFDGLWWG